jgi:hypothetical protein
VADLLRTTQFFLSLIFLQILLVLLLIRIIRFCEMHSHIKKTLARTIISSADLHPHNSNRRKTLFTLHFDPINESISLLVKYYSEYYECFISKNNV